MLAAFENRVLPGRGFRYYTSHRKVRRPRPEGYHPPKEYCLPRGIPKGSLEDFWKTRIGLLRPE